MDLIKDPLPKARTERHHAPTLGPSDPGLERLLLGRSEARLLPSATEVASAAVALANATKRRVVLPVAKAPAELALERRGDEVFVSLYSTTATPEVFVRDRRVPLGELLRVSATSADPANLPTVAGELAARIAERASSTSIAPLSVDESHSVVAGSFEEPKEGAAVSFGFEASFRGATRGPSRGVRADVHALLFEGTLVAHVHERRLVLARGPIVLPVIRMLHAARAFLEGRALRNAPNVRMRVGSFGIGLRGDAEGKVSLTLDGERGASVTAAGLELHDALGAIAGLASSIVREFVAFDRSQGRNLRIRAMRDDLRAISRRRGRRDDRPSFVNDDADRMRAHALQSEPAEALRGAARIRPATASLRYGERWRVALDGLDAASTFLCGDRLVIATAHHTLALSRDDGSVLWARDATDTPCAVAGDVLLRARPDGVVELCSVLDGEPFAEAKLGSAPSSPLEVLVVGGDETSPPIAIVRESASRLSAIDLRTGELVYRFGVRRSATLASTRLGRMLVVASDDTIHGLDAVTGEELFRHVEEGAIVTSVVASRDRLVCVVERPSTGLVLLDAFRGELVARVDLPGPVRGTQLAIEGGVVVACQLGESTSMLRFDAAGARVFGVDDVGLAKQAESIVVDGHLVVSDLEGRISSVALADGSLTWSSRIARAIDDVPRMRKPLLRSGVLFVPGAEVRIVRPTDGSLATNAFPCDLIPDRLLVDERSWVFVAEESGHVAAYAPAAHLTLIRGGSPS